MWIFNKIKYDLRGQIRPLLCYGKVARFCKHSDLLIKLQPWIAFLWADFILVCFKASISFI